MKEALKMALEALEKADAVIYSEYCGTGCEELHICEPAIKALEQALAEQHLQALHDENVRLGLYEPEQEPVAWVTKEQLLQDWLPRLWDVWNDVRHNENASAQETLYELYVEMKQQTIAEKIDTMSEITLEDQLSVMASDLLAAQKRVSELDLIICQRHFMAQTEQGEPKIGCVNHDYDVCKALQEDEDEIKNFDGWDASDSDFDAWWNDGYDGKRNPFAVDSYAYWAWAGWLAAKKLNLELTNQEHEHERFHVATIGNWGRIEWVEGIFPSVGDKMYSAPPQGDKT